MKLRLPCLSLSLVLALPIAFSAAQDINGIAAQVNKRMITLQELQREMLPFLPQIKRSSQSYQDFNKKIKEFSLVILEQLVEKILIVEAFHNGKYQISEDHVNRSYENYVRSTFGSSRAKFLAYLKTQGLTDEEFKKHFVENQIVSMMKQEKIRNVLSVSPKEVEDYYKENQELYLRQPQVKLRVLLLKPLAGENKDVLKQQALQILRELDEGGDFETLVKKYSQGHRADSGGDWGWVKAPDLRDELKQKAFQLEKGQHSEVLEVEGYFYILKVEDKKEGGLTGLDKVRDQIETNIAENFTKEAYKTWIEALKERAYIRYFLEEAADLNTQQDKGPLKMFGEKPKEEPKPKESSPPRP